MARAAKKKTVKKSPKKSAKKAPKVNLRDRIDGLLPSGGSATALFAAIGVAGAFGLFWGVGLLESRAATLLDRPVKAVEIAWPVLQGGEGTWMPEPWKAEIQRLAEETAAQHPGAFSRKQLAEVGGAMQATGWFNGAPTVRRAAGSEDSSVLHVDGAWRVFAGVVRHRGADYLVAWDGGRLPWEYDEGVSGLPVILGVREPAPSRRGESGSVVPDYESPWPGDGVPAALELLRLLSSQPFAAQVAGVQVDDTRARGGLTIITDRGTFVAWGGSPSERKPGEASPEEKLGRLRTLYTDYGHIDAGRSELWIGGTLPVEVGPADGE